MAPKGLTMPWPKNGGKPETLKDKRTKALKKAAKSVGKLGEKMSAKKEKPDGIRWQWGRSTGRSRIKTRPSLSLEGALGAAAQFTNPQLAAMTPPGRSNVPRHLSRLASYGSTVARRIGRDPQVASWGLLSPPRHSLGELRSRK